MGKYLESTRRIFAVFDSDAWKAFGVAAVPADIEPAEVSEYVRVSVIPGTIGVYSTSIAGIINVDIFTVNGAGPLRALEIADQLDTLFEWRSDQQSDLTQTRGSSLTYFGVDADNPAFQRHIYSINFNYYGGH